MTPQEATGVLARLKEAGLLPRKALGQHFLHDPRLLGSLVEEAGVGPRDRVFEVGTGPGTLTRELARKASRVLSVDVDARMLEFARDELRDLSNVDLVCADALDRDGTLNPRVLALLKGIEPFLWVANLPYGIASRLVLAFLESELVWTGAALTLQAEVVDRIQAQAGDPEYGALTALVAFWARASRGRKIPPGAFWPPPEVHSRVLHLEPGPPLGPRTLYPAYRAWVKAFFQARRKQLGGLLRRIVGEEGARKALLSGGWDPSIRPEVLGPADFLLLAREFPAFSR